MCSNSSPSFVYGVKMCDGNCDYSVYGRDTHLMCLLRLVIFVYFLTIASGLFTMIGYNFDCMDVESSVL